MAPSSQQASASQSIRLSPAPQKSNTPPSINPTEFEICIHTCNGHLCRNDSRSFLWPRRQPSLPRHVLSTKKHLLCSPACPGFRFLNMPLVDAMREPRRVKCRSPTEAELALAEEEIRNMPSSQRIEKGARVEGIVRSEGSGEPEGAEEHEGGSTGEEEAQGGREERSTALSNPTLGKRLRSRTDGEESQRSRKLRSRISLTAKP